MKYKEAQEFADSLREFADFIETSAVKLPYFTTRAEFSCYLSQSDYKPVLDENGDPTYDESGKQEYEWRFDEEGTKKKLKRFLDAVGPCEKDWSDDSIKVLKSFGAGNVTLRGYVNREVACKKIVTGKKLIPSVYIPEHEEEEYEWDCGDTSLINLTKDLDNITT